MSQPIFNNSRDRDDFLIALAVIGFFLWLFLFSGIFGKKRNIANLLPAKAAVIADSDEDGLIDSVDECPELYARTVTGCPEGEVAEKKGYVAPVPVDEKMVTGKNKSCCMDAKGEKCMMKDCDPEKCKSGENKDCHKKKGILPIAPVNTTDNDTDGDGIANDVDGCPNKKGTAANNGCPDNDGDGVIDKEDKCPEVAGDKDNDGCPKLVLEAKEKEVIAEAIRDVRFEYGSANLTTPSKAILNKVVSLMEKYENSRLAIGGHTDNDSSSEFNLKLSNDRANSCKNYLVSKGISASRISAQGYGETMPIASNDTEEGRKKNRRVEFDLK